jgi:hypothetical protein
MSTTWHGSRLVLLGLPIRLRRWLNFNRHVDHQALPPVLDRQTP